MNDKDDLSVWKDFIKEEFRVEDKDANLGNIKLSNNYLNQIPKKKKKLPLPGQLTK